MFALISIIVNNGIVVNAPVYVKPFPRETARRNLNNFLGFPKRDVVRIVIDGLPEDAPELLLSRLLDEYRTAREERFASTTRRAQATAGLLIVGLQQRLLSSIEAFARSLNPRPARCRPIILTSIVSCPVAASPLTVRTGYPAGPASFCRCACSQDCSAACSW